MNKLTEVVPLLRKLTYGENLTSEETRRAFNIIGDEDAESYYYLALTFGLMAKSPTSDELYGVCLDRADRVPKISVDIDPVHITDISGGGGGKISTFNISTAASFVIAAGGVYVAKQAAPAVTGFSGSSDLLNEIGVNVPIKKGDPRKVKESLEKVGIAAYYYSAFNPERFRNFLKWRDTIKRIGLGYLTPWHLVSFVYSLIDMKTRVYGLFSDKYLKTLAELFQRFGYRKGMFVYGVDGLDEISNIGPTKICELKDGNISEYMVTPEELGVKRARAKDIEATSREENIKDFLRVLYGKDKGPKRDIVAINAGASFYVTGKVRNLKEGTELAIELINNGKASQKLEQIVIFFNNEEKLNNWKQRVGA